MEWPRIPLPGWPEGDGDRAAQELAESSQRGREIAGLLNVETPVQGVTQTPVRQELAAIAMPATMSGRQMADEDFAVTAGWGHMGQAATVMPGQGQSRVRNYTADERRAMREAIPLLGDTTIDIFLNDNALWRNIPASVWNYKLGGYQVLKKWLSYREQTTLGRRLRPDEVQHFTDTARRIAAILLWSAS